MPQRSGSLLVPLFILLAGLAAGAYIQELPSLALQLLPWLPYLLASVMVFLAWHFNRGKVLLAGGLVLLPAFYPYVSNNTLPSSSTTVAAIGLGLLLLLKERGFFNRFVFNRALFLTMLVAWSMAYERGVINFDFLAVNVPFVRIKLSNLLCWCMIGATSLVSLLYWWRKADGFSTAVLISLASLILIECQPFSSNQDAAIRSAQILIWVWFVIAESHRMAYRDELTQLPSRRALNEAMVALPRRYAIAMLDVDHFKKFNDSYGHDKGDEVLRLVGRVMLRYSGMASVFRYGGEEFTLLFKGKGADFAEDVLEQVREEIQAQRLDVSTETSAKEVSVTASLGVAYVNQGESPSDVIKRADQALYQAKRKGRNRLMVASD
ncbi:GGDEF domain-containing protein [Marinomonas ostreistagni]|uniref:diguanylate cyclase n=1 Tax=Marinomonas ostreistagni TaxID=359209 RepID=A0ABS0Z6A6_9GAMM|nr:GGDEF domain-containing protein [Marinomonas ostreistagni]MBJ7549195.1 GGDEF domain-containing protein [Marinomonas ostreistagni]